jgi:uncharacterized protein with von Willebrand factor type A (vWA) domain
VTPQPTSPDRLLAAVDRAAFVVGLGGRLRRAGVPVSFTALAALTEALAVAPPSDLGSLYWLARLTLVRREHDLGPFDRVFDAVFRDADLPLAGQASGPAADAGGESLPVEPGPVTAEQPGAGLPWHTRPRALVPDPGPPEGRGVPELLPSAVEAVADTPFDELDEETLALVGAWLETSRLRWPTRRSRRRRVHPSGRRVALRETMDASRRTGWEPATLARTRSVRRPRPVTVLVDVSESMRPYSTAYLHVMRVLARSGRAETFAFSTGLTRVTPALRQHSARTAVAQATEQVDDRYGGTRLASSLAELLHTRHGNALRGGVLVVASDGWDSEEPEHLAAVLRRVRRRVHRLVWLNPRSAAPGFQPLVGSMAAALPFCDDFLPAHTLAAVVEALDVLLEDGPLSSRA